MPKGWGAIAKLKKKQELLVRFGYNLGELFRDSPWSYNPLYTQIGQVNKSTLRVNTLDAVTHWLRYHQQSKEKEWSDLGITCVSCLGIHPEAIDQLIPKSVKSTSQHLGSTPWTPCLRYHQQSKEKDWSDLGATWVKCSGIHPEPWTQCTPKTDKLTLRVNTTNAMPKTKSSK